jgi:hypothetical protein
MTAEYFTGIATSSPLDVTGTLGSGTSTTNTPITGIATGTLSQANEIVLGIVGISSSFSNYASNSPFTNLTASGSSTAVAWGYDIVSSTSSVTYAPQWTTARPYGANVVTFKGAAGGGSSGPPELIIGSGFYQPGSSSGCATGTLNFSCAANSALIAVVGL